LMLPGEGGLLLSIANRDKAESQPLIEKLHSLQYGLYATEGTAAMIEAMNLPVKMVTKKLGKGHPNVIDVIRDNSVAGVVNTVTGGRLSLKDGFDIRRAAAEKRIPCFTSLDTARVVVEAMSGVSKTFSVQPMREYLRGKNQK